MAEDESDQESERLSEELEALAAPGLPAGLPALLRSQYYCRRFCQVSAGARGAAPGAALMEPGRALVLPGRGADAGRGPGERVRAGRAGRLPGVREGRRGGSGSGQGEPGAAAGTRVVLPVLRAGPSRVASSAWPRGEKGLGNSSRLADRIRPGCFMIFRVLSLEKQRFVDAGPGFLCSSPAL